MVLACVQTSPISSKEIGDVCTQAKWFWSGTRDLSTRWVPGLTIIICDKIMIPTSAACMLKKEQNGRRITQHPVAHAHFQSWILAFNQIRQILVPKKPTGDPLYSKKGPCYLRWGDQGSGSPGELEGGRGIGGKEGDRKSKRARCKGNRGGLFLNISLLKKD